MKEVTTIGVDLAKNVFQVHGIDAEGGVIVCRQLRRAQMLVFFRKKPPCLVGMEACATALHWARQLIELGHEVKLMPPSYVKPYVKRNKNDSADAAAICEAVTRPTMRFVAEKSAEQQSVLMLHQHRNFWSANGPCWSTPSADRNLMEWCFSRAISGKSVFVRSRKENEILQILYGHARLGLYQQYRHDAEVQPASRDFRPRGLNGHQNRHSLLPLLT